MDTYRPLIVPVVEFVTGGLGAPGIEITRRWPIVPVVEAVTGGVGAPDVGITRWSLTVPVVLKYPGMPKQTSNPDERALRDSAFLRLRETTDNGRLGAKLKE